MKRSTETAIYNHVNVVIVNGKFAQEVCQKQVRVMARAEGYALVRLKGAMPFAVAEKSLEPIAGLTGVDTSEGGQHD